MDEAAQVSIARQVVEKAMAEIAKQWPQHSGEERLRALPYYLCGRLGLDQIAWAKFSGIGVFSQQFEGEPASEIPQPILIAANCDDDEVCKFALYANIGDELKTGGGAAPACTLRRVS